MDGDTKKEEKKEWDKFREIASAVDSGSAHKSKYQFLIGWHKLILSSNWLGKWWFRLERVAKALSYVITFIIVFGCSIVSKGSTLLMIKQLAKNPENIPFCNEGPRGESGSLNEKYFYQQ